MEVLEYMMNLMEYNMLGKQNILLLIRQERAIVNIHYGLIEPEKNTDLRPLQKYCFTRKSMCSKQTTTTTRNIFT